MRRRADWAVAVAAVLVATATACNGSGGDKAGGAEHDVLVLPLATHDPAQYAQDEFAAAVERLSDGSMRIQIRGGWRSGEVEYERGLARDIARGGEVPLGIVGVRAWDTFGVTSFRGVVAPLLVDSLELQRKIVESPLASRLLQSLEPVGLVGIALLPGAGLRPVGVSRVLLSARDYEGARIGIWPSKVAEASLRALGADPRHYPPGAVLAYTSGSLSGLDGAELDLATVADFGYDERAHGLTSNVVLWPRIQTVFMNRAAFDALTPAQRDVLLRAGREALDSVIADIEEEESGALATICERRRLAFTAASPRDLASLRSALQPVYEELERDPETRRLIARIDALRSGTPGPVAALRCEGEGRPSPASSALEGRWRYGPITPEELFAAGLGPEDSQTLAGTAVFDFAAGRFQVTAGKGGTVVAAGTYEVRGDVLRLVFDTGPVLEPGKAYEMRWSVYRDLLRLSEVPGGDSLLNLTAKPLTRVP